MNDWNQHGDVINQWGSGNTGKVVNNGPRQSAEQRSRPFVGEPVVFVNYRGNDERPAFDIDTELTRRLGDGAVFRGGRFPEEAIARAGTCPVMICVIGERWEGTHDPADRVRREIDTAFHHGVHVVPVLVGARPQLVAAELPREIGQLAVLRALHLADGYQAADVHRLVDTLLRNVPALANLRTVD